MKMLITNTILITATFLLCGTGSALAAHDPDHVTTGLFRAHEINLDLFGSASLGQTTLEDLSRSRIEHDGRLGLGAGLTYYFTRHVGLGVDAYTENAGHSFVDSASANLIVRFPLGGSGFAPYAMGGGGRQFDPIELWYAQAGGGMEFRFNQKVGIFGDGRYVMTDETPNYGLFRLGVRLVF